jgi:superfamily I DNA/RNA helicase
VERDYTGPARVSGSAGTGKTIVALHRAVHLARTHPEARVLLTTFSDTLANALHTKLKRLVGSEPRLAERIDVHSLNALGLRLYKAHCGLVNLASREAMRDLLGEASKAVGGHKFSLHFLLTEWEQVVDAWQLETWESYRDVARLGRKTRLPEAQRAVLWSIFERVAKGLEFRAVAVMACDDEIIPLQERIETVGDDADLQEVYDTERHLLYVACTRARDNLLVTSVGPASEFLDDLRA